MYKCVFVFWRLNMFAFISQGCFLISIVHRQKIIGLFPQNLFGGLYFQTARKSFSVCLEIILYRYYLHGSERLKQAGEDLKRLEQI